MRTKFFYKNLELIVFEEIYEPSDDSLLLADCIKEAGVKGKTVLDLGCGSGIQGINALSIGAKSALFTDIDENALSNAKENAERLGFEKQARFAKSELFSTLKGKKFDVIVFNPPYAESEKTKWLDTDGGKKGREVLDGFLQQAKKHLKKKGAVFFLQSSLNGERKTKRLLKELGFGFEVIAKKRLFFEELLVFKAFRT